MSVNDKYNKKKPNEMPKSKGNRDVISKIIESKNTAIQNPVNTGIHENVNTAIQNSVNAVKSEPKKIVKKATFELDKELHKRLRSFAVESEKTMVEIVEKALVEYMDKNKN